MAGRLNKKPWPDDGMTDVFHVDDAGTTQVLTQADATLQTNLGGEPAVYRPSQAGDVLSRVPSSPPAWEGRPSGTNGAYEQNTENGGIRVYSPNGFAEGFVRWDVPNE